jgi:hypothetical protein
MDTFVYNLLRILGLEPESYQITNCGPVITPGSPTIEYHKPTKISRNCHVCQLCHK